MGRALFANVSCIAIAIIAIIAIIIIAIVIIAIVLIATIITTMIVLILSIIISMHLQCRFFMECIRNNCLSKLGKMKPIGKAFN